MISPTYKINGRDRKKLKKELFDLKAYHSTYWRYHGLDLDMVNFLKCENFLKSKKEVFDHLSVVQNKINKIEKDLLIKL